MLWLTVGVVLITELAVFLPSLGHERRTWLERHVREANIAALAVVGAPKGLLDPATRDDLLRLSGDELIRLHRASGVEVVLSPPEPLSAAVRYDLRRENSLTGIGRALAALFRQEDRLISVIGVSPLRPGSIVELVTHERELLKFLRTYARNWAVVSLLIAGMAGGLVYISLLLFLVRPVRRLTDSIIAFRAAPEQVPPLDPESVSLLGDDEMAVAGRELALMQQELREALWRNARLAALGSAVAQVSHDLRNILSSAMLAADRLSACEDPAIRRSGEVLVRSIERALEIARRTLDYAREGPPALVRTSFALTHLIDELREAMGAGAPSGLIVVDIPPGLTLEADREQIFRIFVNLVRNAFEAGARRVAITARSGAQDLEIDITDNGPGLPEAVRRHLFRPFVASSRRGGSGLGLAIARDLARAHGGELVLLRSDTNGTTFRLTLPLSMVSGLRPVS